MRTATPNPSQEPIAKAMGIGLFAEAMGLKRSEERAPRMLPQMMRSGASSRGIPLSLKWDRMNGAMASRRYK